MYASYKLHVDELDDRFLETLKKLFRDRQIEIAVCDTSQSEEDETSYLLRSPANRRRLMQSIENAPRGDNLMTIDPDDLRYRTA